MDKNIKNLLCLKQEKEKPEAGPRSWNQHRMAPPILPSGTMDTADVGGGGACECVMDTNEERDPSRAYHLRSGGILGL